MKELAVFAALAALTIYVHTVGALSFDLTAFLVFVLVIGLLIYRDRKKVKLEGIILIRRTQRGRDFIDRAASKHPAFWRAFGVLGVAVAIFALVAGSAFLVAQSTKILEGEKTGGVKLLLPGPVSAPVNAPGIFVVPWWIWVIGIAIVIIPHEFMHGIMCRLDKIRIKSVGWILLAVIPGAFVEPDEKQLKKAKRATKMRVYAAGSFANIVTAMIVLVILILYTSAAYAPAGVLVASVKDSPAGSVNLTGSITEIDGKQVRNAQDIRNILSSYKPNDTVSVKTLGGDIIAPHFRNSLDVNIFVPSGVALANASDMRTYSVILGSNERGNAYLGIASIMPAVFFVGGDFAVFQAVTTLLLWIYIFSLGIGIVNILPIKPLDGGLLFEEIAGKFFKNPKMIVKAVTLVMVFVLVFNLVGPLVF